MSTRLYRKRFHRFVRSLTIIVMWLAIPSETCLSEYLIWTSALLLPANLLDNLLGLGLLYIMIDFFVDTILLIWWLNCQMKTYRLLCSFCRFYTPRILPKPVRWVPKCACCRLKIFSLSFDFMLCLIVFIHSVFGIAHIILLFTLIATHRAVGSATEWFFDYDIKSV